MSDDPRIVRDVRHVDVAPQVVPSRGDGAAAAHPGGGRGGAVPAQRLTVARTARVYRFYPDAVLAALVGLVTLVVGLIAVVRAGLGHDLHEPAVHVVGFTHTALLGVIEVPLGAALLLAGGMSSRSGAIFFGAIAGIAGFVGAVQTESFDTSLALERSMAWWVCALGVLVVAAALAVPRTITRSRDVRAV